MNDRTTAAGQVTTEGDAVTVTLDKVILSRVSQEDYDAFHALAAEKGLTKAEVIRDGVRRFVGKQS